MGGCLKVLLSLFLCSFALADTQSQKNIRTHAERFHVTSPAELDAQRARLSRSLAAVQGILAREVTSADLFGQFQLATIEIELAERAGNIPALEKTLRALHSDIAPLELPQFESLRSDLRGYLALARSADPTNIAVYRQAVQTLADLEPIPQPTYEQEKQIRDALQTLVSLGQAPALVDYYRKWRIVPNASVRISENVLAQLIPPIPINQNQTFQQTKDGATIVGSGVGRGSGVVRLLPNAHTVKVQARLTADVNANAVATIPILRREAKVGIQSQTHIEGGIPIELSPEWKPEIGDLWLDIRTRTTNQWSTFQAWLPAVQRLGSRVVMNQANRMVPQANAETAAQIEADLRPKYAEVMREKVAPQVNSLSTMIDNAVRFPLMRTGRLPKFAASTDAKHIHASLWFADPTQFSAFNPPRSPYQGDIELKIHESAVNNGSVLLAGTSLEEDFVRETILAGLFEQPEQDKTTGVTLTTLHFAETEPMLMRIEPDGTTLRLNLTGFSQGARRFEYPGTLTAKYVPTMTDDSLYLVREGEVAIDLPGFASDKRAVKILPGLADRVLVPRAQLKLPTVAFELEGQPIKISFRVKKIWQEVRGWIAIQLEAMR